MYSAFVISLAFLSFPLLVLSNIYPTEPVASTTYILGKLASVSWRDDGTSPLVSQLGDVTVDLLCQHDHLVKRIATKLKPTSYSLTFQVPSNLSETSDYFIRFNLPSPYSPVFTARFAIRSEGNAHISSAIGVNQYSSNHTSLKILAGTSTISNSSLLHPFSTPSTTNSTPTILIPPASAHISAPVVSRVASSTSTSLSPTSDRTTTSRGTKSNGISNTLGLAFYLLWPVSLGIVMAL